VRRVLVAGTRDVVEAARAALGAELELVPAYSVAEALKAAASGVELVLCSVRFDDSRMFDFLGALNADAKPLPVICCRLATTPLSAGARRGIELALEALGVLTFVDLYDIEQRDGPQAAQAALRAAVMDRLQDRLRDQPPAQPRNGGA
jgi:hypothetical protein